MTAYCRTSYIAHFRNPLRWQNRRTTHYQMSEIIHVMRGLRQSGARTRAHYVASYL